MIRRTLTVLLCLSSVSFGANYYIATSGDDTTGDGSIGNPWKTFAKLNATLTAGDTGYARAGTYLATANRMINPANSGNAGNHIRYSAYSGEAVFLDGNGKAYENGVYLLNGQDYIDIEGFAFQHWKYSSVILEVGASYITITHCTSVDCQDFPINFGYTNPAGAADHVTIDGCTLITASGNIAGIWLGGTVGNSVRGCTIITFDTDGIISPGNQNTIGSNLIYCADTTGGNHDDGIEAWGTTDLVIENNLIHSFTQGIYMPANRGADAATTNTHIRGNILYNQYYWSITSGEAPAIKFDDGTNTDIVGMYLYNNTFLWNGLQQILIECHNAGSECDDLVIINDIFADGGIDVVVDDALEVTSDYNLFWSSGFQPDTPPQDPTPWTAEGGHSLDHTDPDFTAYDASTWWDYHLLPTSPAIGSGAGLAVLATYFTVPSPWVDRDGNTMLGTTMGADQPPAWPEHYLLGLK